MNQIQPMPLDNLSDVNESGATLCGGHNFHIFFAIDHLQFRQLEIADPVPTGRQIVAAAGLNPRDDVGLFMILPSGDFEDVRLDEPVDVRGRGIEKFIAFKSDRTFRFRLGDKQIVWGHPSILGEDLHFLADTDDATAVFLEVRGGEDVLINADASVDLTASGVERFITGPKPQQGFVITLNSREYALTDDLATYEQIVALEFEYPPSNPNISYSMTYRHAASKPHAGELNAGGSVTVKKKGTVFNVTATDKS